MRYKKVIADLYTILEAELPSELAYHSIEHTRDVHKVCEFYIEHYELQGKDKELLIIAAVGHDVGFTQVYANHEEVSAEITCKIMKSYKYRKNDIDIVEELILATKIPQNPGTFLSQIICDADLDYLGRDDFKEIGNRLKAEWINYDIVPNKVADFNDIQVGFLKSHFYHTEYALEHREPVKERHLEELLQVTAKCSD